MPADKIQTLHVFSGVFGSRENACLYAEEQWEEPEPDDSWSAAAYEEWEERNPSWTFRDELSVSYMDSDFVETIFGDNKLDYLRPQLANERDYLWLLQTEIPAASDTLVLVMSDALGGFKADMSSTTRLRYHGEFRWTPG